MSENTINNNQNPQNAAPPTPDQPAHPPAHYVSDRDEWRAQRSTWREERRAARHSGTGAWIGGAILIVLGLVFLAQNMGMLVLQNWWALFILIPAAGSFSSAYAMYRNNGNRLSYPARGSLLGGIVFTLVAAAFLFNLNFGVFWPVLLILAGVGLLLNFLLPS
jgi:predicted secreted protein